MRKLRALAFTAVLGFALAACSQGGSGAISAIDVDPKSVEAHVTKLAGETFKGTATAAADIDSLRAALPAEVAVSWGGLSFDAATGSTLLTAVKMTPKDNTEVGVSMDELRLYDLDVPRLKASLAGKRPADSGAASYTPPMAPTILLVRVALASGASHTHTTHHCRHPQG